MAIPRQLYSAQIAGNWRGFQGKRALYKGLETELGLTEGHPAGAFASTGKSDSAYFATLNCRVEITEATDTALAVRKSVKLLCNPANVAAAMLALKGKNITVGTTPGKIVSITPI